MRSELASTRAPAWTRRGATIPPSPTARPRRRTPSARRRSALVVDGEGSTTQGETARANPSTPRRKPERPPRCAGQMRPAGRGSRSRPAAPPRAPQEAQRAAHGEGARDRSRIPDRPQEGRAPQLALGHQRKDGSEGRSRRCTSRSVNPSPVTWLATSTSGTRGQVAREPGDPRGVDAAAAQGRKKSSNAASFDGEKRLRIGRQGRLGARGAAPRPGARAPPRSARMAPYSSAGYCRGPAAAAARARRSPAARLPRAEEAGKVVAAHQPEVPALGRVGDAAPRREQRQPLAHEFSFCGGQSACLARSVTSAPRTP